MDPINNDSDPPRSKGVLGSLFESIFSEVKEQTKRIFTDDIPQSIGLTGESEKTTAEITPPATPISTPSPQQTPQFSSSSPLYVASDRQEQLNVRKESSSDPRKTHRVLYTSQPPTDTQTPSKN